MNTSGSRPYRGRHTKPTGFYAGGTLFSHTKEGAWLIFGVTSSKHANEIKVPGGMSLPASQSRLQEHARDCLTRELRAEAGVECVTISLAHVEEKTNGHQRYFYLITEVQQALGTAQHVVLRPGIVSTAFDLSKAVWVLEDFGEGQSHASDEALWGRFVPLETFNKYCFSGHREAFVGLCRAQYLHLRRAGSTQLALSFQLALASIGIACD